MAKKKYTTRLDEIENFVSNEEKIIEDIIKPAVENHYADKVRDLRSKGFDDNRIAAMIGISSLEVKDIK